jgi:hypothetical protein
MLNVIKVYDIHLRPLGTMNFKGRVKMRLSYVSVASVFAEIYLCIQRMNIKGTKDANSQRSRMENVCTALCTPFHSVLLNPQLGAILVNKREFHSG